MLINVALFIYQFTLFQSTDRYFYMRIRTRVNLWLLCLLVNGFSDEVWTSNKMTFHCVGSNLEPSFKTIDPTH